MRAKIAIPLLLVGIMAVLLPFVVRPKLPAVNGQAALPTTTSDNSVQIPVQQPAPLSATPEETQQEPNPNASSVIDHSLPSDNEDYAASRVAELADLAMTDDPQALAEIESELDNPDPRIQEAAVAATIQFGSRDAIPALQMAYQHFDVLEQKVQIQKAIDFLNLPTLSEIASVAVPANGASDGN
jgi:hypothetical protein